MAEQTLTLEGILEFVQKIERRMLEVERKMKEISEQIRKGRDKENVTMQQKSERQRQAQDRKMERARRSIREVIGFTAPFINDMLDEGIIEQFQALGYGVTYPVRMGHSLGTEKIGIIGEFNLTLVDADAVILIKVEETLETSDVSSHIEEITEYCRHLANNRRAGLLPETRLYGAVAGVVITDDAIKFAHDNGLYVIVKPDEDELVEILETPEGFQARQW